MRATTSTYSYGDSHEAHNTSLVMGVCKDELVTSNDTSFANV